MSVYIEYVVIDNFVITTLICLVSIKCLKLKIPKLKVFLAAALGTVVAVCYPFLSLHIFWLIAIRLSLLFALSFILFLKRINLFKGATVFLAISACFGGFIFIGAYIINGDVVSALTLPSFDFPIGLIIGLPLICYYFLTKLVKTINHHRAKNDFIFNFDLTVFGKTLKGTGFLDSGNFLLDKNSGLPVIVAAFSFCLKFLSASQLQNLLLNKGEMVCKNARYINFNTISGQEKILIIKPQQFRLYLSNNSNILKEVMLGLSLKPLKDDYNVLLSPLLF